MRFSPKEVLSGDGKTRGGADSLASAASSADRRRVRAKTSSAAGASSSVYHRMQAMRDALASFQVVVTTCSSAGHELLRGITFPRVLVDECTQSVEPSTLLPLSNGCNHLVLIGDHKQLPPTVVSDEARKMGLDRSMFARLAAPHASSHSAGPVAEPLLLDEQRRMHPSIAAFPNTHFYGGRVRDAAPSRPPVSGVPWPDGDMRVLLVDVQTELGEEQQGTSWRNAAEVDAVLKLASHVLRCDDRSKGQASLPPEEVVVMTPYFQQKQLLQAEFWRRTQQDTATAPLLGQVRVSTIDGFQGAESDLVIFSAVRSNVGGRLGFLSDARRANVALTRARRGLVVFADATTMRQAKGTVWAEWLAWVEGRGGVMPLAEFSSRLPPVDGAKRARSRSPQVSFGTGAGRSLPAQY
ncbi:unnamed protein product [Polarella glacialis]|uniref:RNA helicase n=1 Tax=Polarella glacialis TaxID=89957 RepID=A0A813GED3_POLGL|nr:unnamed protein product [Polarella glacialis]